MMQILTNYSFYLKNVFTLGGGGGELKKLTSCQKNITVYKVKHSGIESATDVAPKGG